MRLRPYISDYDYEYLEKWIQDERVHALWCANLISYPLSREALTSALEKSAREWRDSAYVATEDDGRPVGFFAYSVNLAENAGFLKFVVVDNELRGQGYGSGMLKLILEYAFHITGVSSVQLNVFDVNEAARRCYSKAGFTERSTAENVFAYKGESWGRCSMVISR